MRDNSRWLVLAGVWLLYFMFGLTSAGLAPLVGPITRDLGMSHSEMGTVLGIWQLVYIGAAIPCGAMLDRLGARWSLFIGVLLIALSGFVRSVAPDYLTLCLGVAIFGLGGPIVSAGAPKVVAQLFTGKDRGLAMGIYMTGPAVGSILAFSLTNSVMMPLFGGDWRQVLLVWAAVAAGSSLVWFAISTITGMKASEARAEGEDKPSQLSLIGALLKMPAVRIVLFMSVGIFMFNHGLNNWLPELLHSGGMSAVEAGYWATVPTIVGIAGSLLIPRLATPARRMKVLAALCFSALAATVLLHADTGIVLLSGMVLQGIARATLMTVTILTLVEMRGIGERYAGTASGLFFSAAEVGGASGPVLIGVLFDATGGFDAGLYFLSGIVVLLLFGVWRLSRRSDAVPRTSEG